MSDGEGWRWAPGELTEGRARKYLRGGQLSVTPEEGTRRVLDRTAWKDWKHKRCGRGAHNELQELGGAEPKQWKKAGRAAPFQSCEVHGEKSRKEARRVGKEPEHDADRRGAVQRREVGPVGGPGGKDCCGGIRKVRKRSKEFEGRKNLGGDLAFIEKGKVLGVWVEWPFEDHREESPENRVRR